MANFWNRTDHVLPPDGMIVETKIENGRGCENRTYLYRKRNLWFQPQTNMYVNYTPTHWR